VAVVRCPICASAVNADAVHCPECGGDPRLSADAARFDLERRTSVQPWLVGAGSFIPSAVDTGVPADTWWATGIGAGYLLLLGACAALAETELSFDDEFFTVFLWSPVASLVCTPLAISGARRPSVARLALALKVLSFVIATAVLLVALLALSLLYLFATWE
jgi:hypothetical protein